MNIDALCWGGATKAQSPQLPGFREPQLHCGVASEGPGRTDSDGEQRASAAQGLSGGRLGQDSVLGVGLGHELGGEHQV